VDVDGVDLVISERSPENVAKAFGIMENKYKSKCKNIYLKYIITPLYK